MNLDIEFRGTVFTYNIRFTRLCPYFLIVIDDYLVIRLYKLNDHSYTAKMFSYVTTRIYTSDNIRSKYYLIDLVKTWIIDDSIYADRFKTV